jgi:hypothetical protein
MSFSTVSPSAKREGDARRKISERVRAQIDALVAPRCANCAGEIHAGAVRARGSLFCSVECALAAAVPGLYLG